MFKGLPRGMKNLQMLAVQDLNFKDYPDFNDHVLGIYVNVDKQELLTHLENL